MPAFDPVRDAVLNSPIAQAPTLPTPFAPRLELPSSSSSQPNAPSSPLASPSISRRPTDLAALLNAEYQESPFRTPPSTTPTRSSTLSRLLHSDYTEDKLTTSEPFRRSSNPTLSSTREFVELSPSRSSNQMPPLAKPPTQHQTPSPTASTSFHRPPPDSPTSRSSFASRPSSSSSNPSRPHGTKSPAMPPPPPPASVIPYNPKHRLTPANSVLIPMSAAEMASYKEFRGQGTTRLTKRKRGRSNEPDEVDQPPAKKLAGDVSVVVDHCEFRIEGVGGTFQVA